MCQKQHPADAVAAAVERAAVTQGLAALKSLQDPLQLLMLRLVMSLLQCLAAVGFCCAAALAGLSRVSKHLQQCLLPSAGAYRYTTQGQATLQSCIATCCATVPVFPLS